MRYKLRGHHLICLQFYKGKGYNEIFVRNLDEIMKVWEITPVEVIEGADDVCQKCPYLKENQCIYYGNEAIEKDDKLALELLGIKPGEKVEKKLIEKKIPKIIEIWKKEICQDCEWREVCHT